MGDLISRESVIKALRAKGRELFKLSTLFEVEIATMTAFECVNIVKDAPAVDAVEVVRCKDCVLWERLDEHIGKMPVLNWGTSVCRRRSLLFLWRTKRGELRCQTISIGERFF